MISEVNNELIRSIIRIEKEMFHEVHNIGGKAYCQTDDETFCVMRFAQFLTWNVDTLESYYDDLLSAQANQNNVVEWKYAYMMQFTDPNYYWESIAPYIPEPTDDKRLVVDSICKDYRKWTIDALQDMPFLKRLTRPTIGSDKRVVSADTYFRGELMTFSLNTLKLLHRHVKNQDALCHNLVLETYTNILHSYEMGS